MSNLPHYKNDIAGTEKHEPVYGNLFEVTITPPALVSSSWNQLVLDSIQKISGLDVEKTPGLVEQQYKGAKRRYAAAFPDSTTMDITIDFSINLDDSNSMYTYKALRQWCDLVFDPLTGAMLTKKDYAGGPMTISVHNRRGDIFRQIVAPVIWPMANLTPMELDYSSGANIWMVSMQFAADYWEDMYL